MSSFMIVFLILSMLLNPGVGVNFTDVFESSWAPDHIAVVGDEVTLSLDSASGKTSLIHFISYIYAYSRQYNYIAI